MKKGVGSTKRAPLVGKSFREDEAFDDKNRDEINIETSNESSAIPHVKTQFVEKQNQEDRSSQIHPESAPPLQKKLGDKIPNFAINGANVPTTFISKVNGE